MDKRLDYLVIGIIAFLGGVVANIVAPSRRGVAGFISAAIVGVFCGGVAGMAAHAYGASPGSTYLVCAACGVLGDRLLSALLERFSNRPAVVNHFNGDNANVAQGQNVNQNHRGQI